MSVRSGVAVRSAVSSAAVTALASLCVVVIAVGVGVSSSIDPAIAVAAVGGAIAVPAAILKPRLLPHILVVSIYAEILSVGGVTIGRIVAPLALVAVASQVLRSPTRLRGAGPTLLLVGAYSALAVASLAWSVSGDATVNALGSLAIALITMAAFALLVRDRRDVRILLSVITISALLLGLWWIVSFAAGINRFENQAGDPNFLALFQVVAIPLVLVKASTARTAGTRFLLFAVTGLIAGSVISTLSRGGVVTLAAAVLAIAVVPARTLFRSRPHKVAFFAVAGVGVVVLLVLAWGPLSQRFQHGFEQQNVVGARGDLWLAAVHGYQQHPLTGLGFGGFKAKSFQLLSSTPGVDLLRHLQFRLLNGEYVHDVYLGSLAELGPLGLVLFLGVLAATARSLLRTGRRAAAAGDPFIRSVSYALLVSLVAYCVASIFLSSETSRILWMIIGLSLALPSMVSEEGSPKTAMLRLGTHAGL
jgi:O-antigen ligase